MSSVSHKLVYPLEKSANTSCSLSCFKIHKENCTSKPVVEVPKAVVVKERERVNFRASALSKIKKEYVLLSAGQLASLRNALSSSRLTSGKNDNLKTLMAHQV